MFHRIRRAVLAMTALTLAAGCGGGGGSPGPSKVFVAADYIYVVSFANPQLAPGPLHPDRTFGSTHFNLISDLAYDATRDLLYVTSELGGDCAVTVFEGPGMLEGELVPPDRIIRTSVDHCRALALDATNDVLYVAVESSYSDTSVWALNQASTRDGSVTADRTLSVGSVSDMALDASRAVLYVLSSGGVVAYADADTAQGSLAADRSVYSGPVTHGLALDPGRDTLYVARTGGVNPGLDGVVVIPGASTATSVADPVLLAIPGADRVDVDAGRDRLYAFSEDVATVIDEVSTATPGNVDALQAQAPEGTHLIGAAFAP